MARILFRLTARTMPRAAPVPVDVTIGEGDLLDFLEGATVVYVPGQTPSSIALYAPSEGVLICGDVIDHRGNRLGLSPKSFTVDMDQARSWRRCTAWPS